MIDSSMASVASISANVVNGIKEVTMAAKQLNDSMQIIREANSDLGSNIEALDNDLKRFTV